ncbi:MAG: hypothetical protein LBI37_00610 [Puniceicoccales bacterium]|jgi:hypothetical protein|nr:hypothetical protein [Puniceicoccales bacterium]
MLYCIVRYVLACIVVFSSSGYAFTLEVNDIDYLGDKLQELIDNYGINLERDIMFVDIDDTIIHNGSDYAKNPTAVSDNFISWLNLNARHDCHILGLTSATTYSIQLVKNSDPCGTPNVGIHRSEYADIRSTAMKRFGIEFWNPFNTSEIRLPFIGDVTRIDPKQFKEEFSSHLLDSPSASPLADNSMLYISRTLKGIGRQNLLIEKTINGHFIEIYGYPVFLDGIIFANFMHVNSISSISQINAYNGERKGDVIISFLKELDKQKILNVNYSDMYIIVVDDNPHMLKHIELTMAQYKIKVLTVYFHWKHDPIYACSIKPMKKCSLNGDKQEMKSMDSSEPKDFDIVNLTNLSCSRNAPRNIEIFIDRYQMPKEKSLILSI